MTQPYQITIEMPKAITVQQERDLVREALAKNPVSLVLKRRLAAMLVITNEFEEAVDLFDQIIALDAEPKVASYSSLAQALLSRENEADTIRAGDAARKALALAVNPAERSHVLAQVGKVQARLGDVALARDSLAQALVENPENKEAYKRLVAVYFAAKQPGDIVALSDGLLAKGVNHSRLLGSRTMALAQLGKIAAAQEAGGLDHFCYRDRLSPPVGWGDMDEFNAGLAAEMMNHPALRLDRYGAAARNTWQIYEPATGNPPHVAALQKMILAQVDRFGDSLSGHDHPWARARPARGIFKNWCLINGGEGFVDWHVHQSGWLSGVYYVAVPKRVCDGDDLGGCLALGLPENLVGEQAAADYGMHVIRPEPGLLAMFPGHSFHRTFAHGTSENRICFAFDVWPG
ncbi:MAG: hypothetical protein RL367_2019 [Pseudomonadota bacterium]